MKYHELPTPALTVDLHVLEQNISDMAQYCEKQGVGLRPHTKTHKVPEIARLQLKAGALGLTVAKTGEAEVMAAAGLDNILVAFPVFGRDVVRRMAQLARDRRMLVSLDDEITAQALSEAVQSNGATLGILVEFDSGSQRCGLPPGPALLGLARKIEKLPGLRFRGLMTFFGAVWGTGEERKRAARRVAICVEQAVETFRKAGMQVEIVSGGSTPSAPLTAEIPGLTEIRPGTYALNDINTVHQGVCRLEDCAARVVSTVVSTAVRGRAIIDAGSKALSSEALKAGPRKDYGYVVEAPEARLFALSEEHGHLDIEKSTRSFRVGDMVTVIPNHVCSCVNLHDEVFIVRQGEVVGSWPIAARGKVR